MFSKVEQRRLAMRSWPQFTVPFERNDGTRITTQMVRRWCKRSLVGDFRLETIKRTSLLTGQEVSFGVLARIEQVEDQVLFKLRWHDFKC